MSLTKPIYKSYRKVCTSSFADPTLFANKKIHVRLKSDKNNSKNNNKNRNNANNPSNQGVSSVDDMRQEPVGRAILESAKVNRVRMEDGIPVCTRPYLCTYRTPGALILGPREVERISREQKYKSIEEIEAEQQTRLENTLEKIEELENCRCLWKDMGIQQECMADDSRCEEIRKYNARNELYPYGRIRNEEEMRLLNILSSSAENNVALTEQIKEKEDTMCQWRGEEFRLDAEMEKMRQVAIGMEEELKARKKKDLMIGLVNQINCKKLEKIEEAEKKHLEGEALRKCWERENLEELEKLMGGNSKRNCYKEQLDICMLQKVKKKIEDDTIDKAVIERTDRIRKELEDKKDENVDNRSKRIEKQQKIADMMRCRQDIIRNKEIEAEIKRIQRSVDQMDRDYRRREQEDMCTRKEIEFKVKLGRDNQIKMKRELQAIEAVRDRLYFESDLRKLIEEIEREKGAEGRKQKGREYGNILRQQMCDNEELRKEWKSEKYKEGRELAKKECMRRKLIEEEMKERLCCLRSKGVSEQTIKKITDKVVEEFNGPKFKK